MKTYSLSIRQREILESIQNKLPTDLKQHFENALNNTLTAVEIERLCQLINDEFLMNGINDDYSPNNYGRELEELLDVINRPRLRMLK